MSESVEGNFLGLVEDGDSVDVAILSLPYELTTSYGQGTAQGPAACIAASAQVELFDPALPEDLPAGCSIHTAEPWDGEGDSLLAQLDGITSYLIPWFCGDCFPIVLGGEHGILPAVVRALDSHPFIDALEHLTIVQVDAHADLRSQLDGEPWSHACAAARSLDMGVGRLLQVGVRTYSREEAERMSSDDRITTWFAKDILSPCAGQIEWQDWLNILSKISGPVHLSIDIDGLDGSLVPDTGTPVPGGLHLWHLVESIETLFSNEAVVMVSADVNEIVPGKDSPLTQFTAALLATKVLAAHISARRAGRWQATSSAKGKKRKPWTIDYFRSLSL